MSESVLSSTGQSTAPGTPSAADRVREWWRITISDTDGDRAARAALRRCTSPRDALAIPAALALARRLGRIPEPGAPHWKARGFERALGLAIVLSHVETDGETRLLRTLGWPQFPHAKPGHEPTTEQPLLREPRFKRFLQSESEDELIAAFVRLIRLARHQANIADLAHVFLNWGKDRTRRDLALAYFNANQRGLATTPSTGANE